MLFILQDIQTVWRSEGNSYALHKRLSLLTVPFLNTFGCHDGFWRCFPWARDHAAFNADGCSVKINPVVLFERTTSPLNETLLTVLYFFGRYFQMGKCLSDENSFSQTKQIVLSCHHGYKVFAIVYHLPLFSPPWNFSVERKLLTCARAKGVHKLLAKLWPFSGILTFLKKQGAGKPNIP